MQRAGDWMRDPQRRYAAMHNVALDYFRVPKGLATRRAFVDAIMRADA
jgi:hypothetical protein